MKKFIVSAVTLIHILLINLSMIMIVAMLLLVFVNVVLRYVFNSGIYWSEEVALVLEVWFYFPFFGAWSKVPPAFFHKSSPTAKKSPPL